MTMMSTNKASKMKTHRLKRKRVDEYGDDEEEEEKVTDDIRAVQTVAEIPPKNTNMNFYSSATQSTTAVSSTTPPLTTTLPPLQDIPETVEVLYEMIRAGGCPRCGRTLHCRRTYNPKESTNYYTCDACHNDFPLPPPTTTTNTTAPPHKRKYNDDDSNNNKNNHDDDAIIFQSKLYLQTLVQHAQSEIVKHDMKSDYVKFQRKAKKLINQIQEKRKRIATCLSVSADDKDGDGERKANRTGSSNTSSFATSKHPRERMVEHEDNVDEETEKNEEIEEKDPFQESIRLLKQETRNMEQVMDDLIDSHHYGSTGPNGDNGGRGPQQSLPLLFSSLREPACSSMRQQKDGADETMNLPSSSASTPNIDIVNENPTSASVLRSVVTKDGETVKYRLASRILQEDGEEIEIYEKDMDA